jgi:hypothetical protein
LDNFSTLKDGGDMFLRNGAFCPNYTALQPKELAGQTRDYSIFAKQLKSYVFYGGIRVAREGVFPA